MIFYSSRNSVSFEHSALWTTHARGFASVVLVAFLTSCASDPTHQLGLKQVKEGPVEEGIANLKKASMDHPRNVPFRVDYLTERDRAVDKSLLEAIRAFKQGDLIEAEAIYQRILTIDPDNAQAKLGIADLERSRKHNDAMVHARDAMERAEYVEARNALQPVLLEDPTNVEANKLSEEINAVRFNGRLANPLPELKATFKKPVSMQFRDANLKMVLEALSKSSGLNILMDKDIKADLKTTIFVKDASVEDVISLVLMQNQLEKKVINETTVYIYPNTPAKVKEFKDLVVRTFMLTNADAKLMLTMLKTVLKVNDVFVNEKNNSIVIRDTPDVVELAGKLLSGQDQNEPEVMLEVEVLEVSYNKLQQLGVKYPTQVSFNVLNGGSATAGLTLQSLKDINPSNIGVSDLGLGVDLKLHDENTDLLASPRIRVKQNEKAKIHIGDKIPVFNSQVTPSTTGAIVSGSVQYLDVGLKLEVEPQIHIDGEVSIKTNLEVSEVVGGAQTGPSGTTAYQIGTRNASTVLRLRDGETQVLAGLIRDRESKAADKIPGLGDLPLLGRLFSTRNTDKQKREIILSITPHIVRNQHQPDANLSSYWSGTGNTVSSRPLTVEKMDTIKIESPGANQPNGAVPVIPVPRPMPAPVSVTPAVIPVVPIAPVAAPAGVSSTPARPQMGGDLPSATPGMPRGVMPAPNPVSDTSGGSGMSGATVNPDLAP